MAAYAAFVEMEIDRPVGRMMKISRCMEALSLPWSVTGQANAIDQWCVPSRVTVIYPTVMGDTPRMTLPPCGCIVSDKY